MGSSWVSFGGTVALNRQTVGPRRVRMAEGETVERQVERAEWVRSPPTLPAVRRVAFRASGKGPRGRPVDSIEARRPRTEDQANDSRDPGCLSLNSGELDCPRERNQSDLPEPCVEYAGGDGRGPGIGPLRRTGTGAIGYVAPRCRTPPGRDRAGYGRGFPSRPGAGHVRRSAKGRGGSSDRPGSPRLCLRWRPSSGGICRSARAGRRGPSRTREPWSVGGMEKSWSECREPTSTGSFIPPRTGPEYDTGRRTRSDAGRRPCSESGVRIGRT